MDPQEVPSKRRIKRKVNTLCTDRAGLAAAIFLYI
jgi:hypothetical protein